MEGVLLLGKRTGWVRIIKRQKDRVGARERERGEEIQQGQFCSNNFNHSCTNWQCLGTH